MISAIDESMCIGDGPDVLRGQVSRTETGPRPPEVVEIAPGPGGPQELAQPAAVTVSTKKGKRPAVPEKRQKPPAEHLCLDPEEMSFKNGVQGKYFSPFTKIPRWLYTRQDITWRGKIVAQYLLSLMFGKLPWRCHVGSAAMQKSIGLSRKVVDAGVKELEDAGMIAVVSGGKNLANDYYWLKTAVPKDIVEGADGGTSSQDMPPETTAGGTLPQSVPLPPQSVGTLPQDVPLSPQSVPLLPQDTLYSPLTTPLTTPKGEGTGREEEKAATASAALRALGGAGGEEAGSRPPKTAASQTCPSPDGDAPRRAPANPAVTVDGDELCLTISRVSDQNLALYANPAGSRQYLETSLTMLPAEFRDQRLGHYSDDVSAVFNGWFTGTDKKPTVLLYSETPGTGKSSLAAALFIDMMRRRGMYHRDTTCGGYSATAMFVDMDRFLSLSKDTRPVLDESGERTTSGCVADEFNRSLRFAPVLWLDDVLCPGLPAEDLERVRAVLKARYGDRRHTLITTNFSRKKLIEALGPAVWSRVKGDHVYKVNADVVYRDDARAKQDNPAFQALVARNEEVRSNREIEYAARREAVERAQRERAAEAEKAAATAKRRAQGITEVDDQHEEALCEDTRRTDALKCEADKIAKAKAEAEAEARKQTPEYKAKCAEVRELVLSALLPSKVKPLTGPVTAFGRLIPTPPQAQFMPPALVTATPDLQRVAAAAARQMEASLVALAMRKTLTSPGVPDEASWGQEPDEDASEAWMMEDDHDEDVDEVYVEEEDPDEDADEAYLAEADEAYLVEAAEAMAEEDTDGDAYMGQKINRWEQNGTPRSTSGA